MCVKATKSVIMVGALLALVGCAEVKKAPEPNMAHLIPVNTNIPPELAMQSAPVSDTPHVDADDNASRPRVHHLRHQATSSPVAPVAPPVPSAATP